MLLQRELYAVPSAAFCLGEEQIGAQQFNNSCTFCYFSPLHTNLDRRSTEPTEITPFLGNFPDSTLSSPSRTGNALILGLDTVDSRSFAKSFATSLSGKGWIRCSFYGYSQTLKTWIEDVNRHKTTEAGNRANESRVHIQVPTQHG